MKTVQLNVAVDKNIHEELVSLLAVEKERTGYSLNINDLVRSAIYQMIQREKRKNKL